MLVSSDAQRRDGYGLPTSEYRHLWETRSAAQPLAASQFWIGRYTGHRRIVAAWATPVTVSTAGLPQPNLPQGYAMTIVLGQLVLHGLRYTMPSLQVEVTTGQELPVLWPITKPIAWPGGTPVDDAVYLSFAGGKDLRSLKRHIEILPWTPATELPQSLAIGDMIELPTACGKHLVYYPAVLVDEAMRGRFYAFGTSCECDIAYLIQTERDGAHCKDACPAEAIAELCESLPGEEVMIEIGTACSPANACPHRRVADCNSTNVSTRHHMALYGIHDDRAAVRHPVARAAGASVPSSVASRTATNRVRDRFQNFRTSGPSAR